MAGEKEERLGGESYGGVGPLVKWEKNSSAIVRAEKKKEKNQPL